MPAIPVLSLTLSPSLTSCECLWMTAFVRRFCHGWTNQWISLVSSSGSITSRLGYSLMCRCTLYLPPFFSLERKGAYVQRFHKSRNNTWCCLSYSVAEVTCVPCCSWGTALWHSSYLNTTKVKPDGICDCVFASVWKSLKLLGLNFSHFFKSYKRLLETLVAFLKLFLPRYVLPREKSNPVKTHIITFKAFMSRDL